MAGLVKESEPMERWGVSLSSEGMGTLGEGKGRELTCKEGPSQIKPQRRMATCLRLGRPLKVSIEQGSEPQDRKWLVRKGGIKGYGPRDSLIPVPHIQGQQRSCRDVLPRFASRWQ